MIDDIVKKIKYKPIVLLILDGWGLSPSWGGNAISFNNPPTMDMLWKNYPKTILQSFKILAGARQKVGNSEIGHASIGAGRNIYQDITEIDKTIANNSFFNNINLIELANYTKENKSSLHLIGMVSDGAVHSHIDHLFALLKFAKEQKISNTFIHVITDGRDVESHSALSYLAKLERKIEEIGFNIASAPRAKIATVIGRYYGMDRNDNTKLTKSSYELMVYGKGNIFSNALKAVSECYKANIKSDEYLPPCLIANDGLIKAKDAVLFFNFRADRMRQLVRFFADKKYLKKFLLFRKYPILDALIATLTSYRLNNLQIKIIFPPAKINSTLAQIISQRGLKQLHVAESEKYAHVTYFFNGGNETPFPNEKRVIFPSRPNDIINKNVKLRAEDITKEIIFSIKGKEHDLIVANYGNVDMFGHTSDFAATSSAIKVVDNSIKKIMTEVIKNNAALIITADHGNAEQMINKLGGDPESRHTLNPVPFILVTPNNQKNLFKSALTSQKMGLDKLINNNRSLADVAPTILELLEIPKPIEMTGKSLLNELE